MSRTIATGTLAPPAGPPPNLDDLLDVDWFRYSILKPENARALHLAVQHMLNPPDEAKDLEGTAKCDGNCVFSKKQKNQEQDAKDADRMSDKELEKAAKANGYGSIHELKDDYGLDGKTDIFTGKNGDLYEGNRKGTGVPQPLGINKNGR